MTQPTPREIRTVSVHGRDVKIRRLADTQLLLIAREAKVLQRTDIDLNRKMDSVDRMFMILETAVIEPEDRQYMESLMITGDLDMKELISFVTTFGEEAEDETPKVRRGSRPVRR